MFRVCRGKQNFSWHRACAQIMNRFSSLLSIFQLTLTLPRNKKLLLCKKRDIRKFPSRISISYRFPFAKLFLFSKPNYKSSKSGSKQRRIVNSARSGNDKRISFFGHTSTNQSSSFSKKKRFVRWMLERFFCIQLLSIVMVRNIDLNIWVETVYKHETRRYFYDSFNWNLQEITTKNFCLHKEKIKKKHEILSEWKTFNKSLDMD